MSEISQRSRFQGAMLGVAIGDGMGMPVETMGHSEIMKLNDSRGVIGFMHPVQKLFPEIQGFPPATTTDDWQLTAAVARSLIRTKGTFDQQDCAEEHIREWERDHSTWGKSTRTSIQELAEGSRGKRGWEYPPSVIPGKTGLGNGVIMKVTPLALAYFFRQPDSFHNCQLLGMLTHGDKRASIAAYAVMHLMHTILRGDVHKDALKTTREVESLIGWLVWDVRSIERFYSGSVNPEDEISARLERIFDCTWCGEVARTRLGCGFTALETAPFAIATFLRHPNNFRAGVLEAVNAGGDTDTNASVVGALIGANVGIEGIPKEWLYQCPVKDEAIKLADSLNCRP